MSKLSFKFLKRLYLPSFGILCIANALGLAYIYQQSQTIWPKLKLSQQQQNHELNQLQQQQHELQTNISQTQKEIAKKPLPSNELQHVEWLIQQAYWQVNTLYQFQTAQHLLEFAYQFSEKNHWNALEKTLLKDIGAIKTAKLSSPLELLTVISSLNQELQTIKWDTPTIDLKSKPEISSFELLKPFIQIEKIHTPIKAILPPNEQYVVLQNLKVLLPQIQIAALSHQQDLFHELVTQFSSQWNLIAKQHSNPSITKAINFLNQMQWVLLQDIPLQSLQVVHQLQQQINTRA